MISTARTMTCSSCCLSYAGRPGHVGQQVLVGRSVDQSVIRSASHGVKVEGKKEEREEGRKE